MAKTMTALDDVLRQSGIEVVSVGREITARCPFHPDKHPSFSMNASNGLWICYQCQERGTLEFLLKRVSGAKEGSIRTILRELQWEEKKEQYGAPFLLVGRPGRLPSASAVLADLRRPPRYLRGTATL